MFYSFNYHRWTICIYACVLCLYICILYCILFSGNGGFNKEIIIIIVDYQPSDNEVPGFAYLSMDPFNYFHCYHLSVGFDIIWHPIV